MSPIPDTPGLPSTLYFPLRNALRECTEFFDVGELRSVFDHAKLLPFKYDIPMAGSAVNGRVDTVMGYLRNKYLTSQENALTLFLNILAERRDEQNAQHHQLQTLAREWEWYRQRPRGKPNPTNPEANPEHAQMLHMADAEKMLANARGVARVGIRRFRNGEESGDSSGTGWLLTPSLALTCWHVIEAKAQETADDPIIELNDLNLQVGNALFTFDYVAQGQGLAYGVAGLEYPTLASHSLDYALLRLQDRSDHPLSERGHLQVDAHAPLTVQTSLYIIQHPLGQPQQGAGDQYVRPASTPGRILYKTPTEPGTSGAPVFNRANWKVVALHNCENRVAGLREGTLLKAILAELKQHRGDLYREIMDAAL